MSTGGNHSSTAFPVVTQWTATKMIHSEFSSDDDVDDGDEDDDDDDDYYDFWEEVADDGGDNNDDYLFLSLPANTFLRWLRQCLTQ